MQACIQPFIQGKKRMNSDPDARGAVDRVYDELKLQAISYAIKPGSRLNEGDVARRLGVSRTPVREALNRLTAAGFLSFTPSQGFFRKPLDATEIFDLYEMRQAIEVASVRLAEKRASDVGLAELDQFLTVSEHSADTLPVDHLVRFDEEFHERIVTLSGNREMLQCLMNVNERIRFFRWVDMESGRRKSTQVEHRQVLSALQARDGERAALILHAHIARRREQIIAQVREGYARIYVDGPDETVSGFTNTAGGQL
jgi:DNA-binding GntR family transcriptional regulator